jgi:hypothetical protein
MVMGHLRNGCGRTMIGWHARAQARRRPWPVAAGTNSPALVARRHRNMISRTLLVIGAVLVGLSSAAADRFREGSSDCLAFPEQQSLSTYLVRIVLRVSGIVEISNDIAFKTCRAIGVRRISVQRPIGYSDYSSETAVVQSGERRTIPTENITTDSAGPPTLGGGKKTLFHYVVPPLLPGDELHETVRASAAPILSGNQLLVQSFLGIQDAFAYDVVFESERTDVTARLVDPAQFLSPVLDSPTRKEWRSERPRPGTLPAPRLEITTLGDWAKVAHEARAVYFMDPAKLEDLQAAGIQPVPDAEALFKEFTFHFGTVTASESRTDPRPLASILQTKGGDCKSLTFLFLNLLRWAGVDAELVLDSERHHLNLTDVFSFADLDHILVYVPSLDRYFDPTLPAGWQQQQRDRTMRSKNRIHVAAPPDGRMRPPPACADYCILPGGGRPNADPIHAVRVRTETIRGYPSPRPATGVHAPSQQVRADPGVIRAYLGAEGP